MIGSQDLMIALAIGLILFGSKKLPELARGLGQSLKEFKKATSEAASESPAPTASALPPAVGPAPPAAGPARTCAACQTELQPAWSHCPTCGAPAAKG
jgi:sec-independent protein translocase protein TatA